MKNRLVMVVSFSALFFCATARGVVRPPGGAVLPDYDVRAADQSRLSPTQLSRPLALGGRGLARNMRNGFFEPSAGQETALADIRKTAGVVDIDVQWNKAAGYARSLHAVREYLTPAASGSPRKAAEDFLRAHAALFNLTQEAVGSFATEGEYRDSANGVTHIQMQQYIGGYPVIEGLVRFNVTRDNRIINVLTTSHVASTRDAALEFRLTTEDAVLRAAREVSVPLARVPERKNAVGERVAAYDRGPFRDDILVMPAVFPVGGGGRACYMVWLDVPGYAALYQVALDAATGELLSRQNLMTYVETDACVFLNDPVTDGGTCTQVFFPDPDVHTTPDSPLGWIWEDPSPFTIGNNADVKLDRDGDNEVTVGFRASGQVEAGPPKKIHFNFSFTDTYATTGTLGDTSIALVNSMYNVSRFHDWIINRGFTESAGNFQDVNLLPVGVPGDAIYVDVQDGWSTGQRNNANFGTRSDGVPGRLQLFMFTNVPGFSLRRDPSFDPHIVMHEYTHGVSNRLVGGPGAAGPYTSCMQGYYSRALGEGWSDFFALSMMDDTMLSPYITGDSVRGMRSEAVDGNAYDLCDFCQIAFIVPAGTCEEHNNGEIWASTMWDLRTQLKMADPVNGQLIAEKLIIDGMKFSPCGPTFLDARDAILLADQADYAGEHYCLIWQVFADRGMGLNAVIAGNYDENPVCDNTNPCATGAGKVALTAAAMPCRGTGTVTVNDSNASAPVNVTLTSTLAGDTLVLSLPQSGIPNAFAATFPIAEAGGPPDPNGLEVADGDTITAEYQDVNPSATVQVTATSSCVGGLLFDYRVTDSDCADDALPEFTSLRGFLDAGETANLTIIVENPLAIDVHSASLAITSLSPKVRVLETAAKTIGVLPGRRGATSPTEKKTVSFRVMVAPDAVAGDTADIGLTFSSDEYNRVSTSTLTVPLMKDYVLLANQTTPVEGFEGSASLPAGWYIDDYNPGTAEWQVVTCSAATGTNSMHDGNLDCVSPYNEAAVAVVNTAPINFVQPGVIETWKPVAMNATHRVDFGGADWNGELLAVWLSENDPAGMYQLIDVVQPSASTGTNWVPYTIPLNPHPFASMGIINFNKGALIGWRVQRDGNPATSATGYFFDDYSLTYDAAQIVDQTQPCGDSYQGTLTSCAQPMTLSVYNTRHQFERQYGDNGAFFLNLPGSWAVLESEFPTASAPGDTVVLVASSNPDDGAHQGVMAINALTVPGPKPVLLDFGPAACAIIPTPVPATTTIGDRQSLNLTWAPFFESGSATAIVGYEVYRLLATGTHAPAQSTIDDYVNEGDLVGTTVGQPNINQFVDTLPDVTTTSPYTYAIRPILAGTGGPIPLSFNDTESTPGKPSLSTDSVVVNVDDIGFVEFDFWRATRVQAGIEVTWGTRTEIGTDGFYVLRGGEAVEASMSPAHTLPITATGGGSTYRFVDTQVPAGGPVYYQVLELTSSGEPSRSPIFTVEDSRSTNRGR